MADRHFTPTRKCEHCDNLAPGLIATVHSQVKTFEDGDPGRGGTAWDAGYVYELLECPACSGVTFRRRFYHEHLEDDEPDWQVLFPPVQTLVGLPPSIERAYTSARRVRNIDANAFGVLLGRVLDAVCADRGASGDTLFERLKHLSEAGEIPRTLVDIAHSLRQLRNVGAHGDLGELTPAEIPLLEDLTRAILEYVYRAPILAAQAQRRVKEIRVARPGAADAGSGADTA